MCNKQRKKMEDNRKMQKNSVSEIKQMQATCWREKERMMHKKDRQKMGRRDIRDICPPIKYE